MAILKVTQLGHPVLRGQAKPLTHAEVKLPQTQRLIDDMIDTMREYEGVGLAAPQVYMAKQIVVIELTENSRYPDMPKIPLMVLINPRISERSEEMFEDWEGCLSIPDLRGLVPRHESLVCEALDRQGKPLKLEAKGFFARVVQHEWDHLQGDVYLDRMRDFRTLTHLSEFTRFWVENR